MSISNLDKDQGGLRANPSAGNLAMQTARFKRSLYADDSLEDYEIAIGLNGVGRLRLFVGRHCASPISVKRPLWLAALQRSLPFGLGCTTHAFANI